MNMSDTGRLVVMAIFAVVVLGACAKGSNHCFSGWRGGAYRCPSRSPPRPQAPELDAGR